MLTRLLNFTAFVSLLLAFIGAILFCWSAPRALFRTQEPVDRLLNIIPLNVGDVLLFSIPTVLVFGIAWIFAWRMLLRDSSSGAWPVPQFYLAFFTVIGIVLTLVLAWRVIYIFLQLLNPNGTPAGDTMIALISGLLAFLPSVMLWLYHGFLWRSYRRFYRRLEAL
jgi:hypothetical protein